MKTIGVTGGIGSGKTTVCRIFEGFGIPVFITDIEARKLLFIPHIKKKVIEAFGNQITNYGLVGTSINGTKLANVVFNDSKKLKTLNDIIHPEIWNVFLKWQKTHKDKPYVMAESALLFESGLYKKFDYLITVTAPEKLRIQRVTMRNGVDESDTRRRMANQFKDSVKIKGSDFVIVNDGKKPLEPQVMKIYTKLANKV